MRGVNLLCPHLEGYSLRGIRKRDYPPAMYYQQPWWGDYEMFTSAMSRIGMLLAEGSAKFDTLLIHPQTSAWITFDNGENEGLEYYQDALDKAISALEQKHILFDLGDEIMMERHARVDGDTFIIGKQRYKTVVLPAHKDFFENTKNLLAQFEKNGGKIVRFEDIENLAENRVCDNAEITYTRREFDGFTMHYFVNSTGKEQKCKFFVGNKKFDIMTGKTEDFCGEYTFAPTDSIVLFDTGEKAEKTEEKPLESLALNGEWEIKKADENAFVLDFCDLYTDGKFYGRVHINSVQQIACGFKKRVNIKCVFDFSCDVVPDKIFLVCETPEKFKFTVNGAEYKFCDVGNYIDISFRKSDISKYLKTGKNVIETECDFVQRDEIYENLEKSRIFESEKNKLTYDTEIEAMYLVGNFSAKARGGFEKLDKNDWSYPYIASAEDAGIIDFLPYDTDFDEYITREQTAVISAKILEFSGVSVRGDYGVLFTDDSEINAQNKKYVYALKDMKVLNGFGDGSFMPSANLRRCDSAVIIYKLREILKNSL